MGVSMRALSGIAARTGATVTGSDLLSGGHDKNNIANKDLVVYSGAIPEDNEELSYARKLGIPVMERAEFLAFTASAFSYTVAVAGCHGKTTVTAMTGEVMSGLRPTVHMGGEYEFGFTPGKATDEKSVFITEACEYRRSFLKLRPDLAVITNIDFDHPDTYRGLSDVAAAFRAFAERCGKVIYNGDDALCRGIAEKGISFGFSEKCDYAVRVIPGGFSLKRRGRDAGEFFPRFCEPFNIKNAAAAVAAGCESGVPYADIKSGIERFSGVKRRGEIIAEEDGCVVMSDYSHHPAEISERLHALKKRYGEVAVIFQPHTYSRTQALADRFKNAFSAADKAVFTQTFAAREKEGDDRLIYELAKNNCDCEYAEKKDLPAIYALLKKRYKCVVIMGAGDIQRFLSDKKRDEQREFPDRMSAKS